MVAWFDGEADEAGQSLRIRAACASASIVLNDGRLHIEPISNVGATLVAGLDEIDGEGSILANQNGHIEGAVNGCEGRNINGWVGGALTGIADVAGIELHDDVAGIG